MDYSSRNDYDYENAAVVLIPGIKIIFLNFKVEEKDEFDMYKEDFLYDIGFLVDDYDFSKSIGRPRVWKKI